MGRRCFLHIPFLSPTPPFRPSHVLPSPLLIFFFLLLFFFLFFFLLFILPFLVFLSSFLSLPLSFLLSFTSLFHFSHSPLSCRLLPSSSISLEFSSIAPCL